MHLSLLEWISFGAFGIVALGIAFRDALSEDSPMARWTPKFFRHRIWSYVPIFAFVVAVAVYGYKHWADTENFVDGWPDAIRCQWQEPHMGQNQKTDFIYYLQTSNTPRAGLHAVASYFMPGGCMVDVVEKGTGRKLHDYLPHEIWFDTESKKLVTPDEQLRDAEINLSPSPNQKHFRFSLCLQW